MGMLGGFPIWACLLTILLGLASAQDTEEIRARIDQFVGEVSACYNIPGSTLAAVREGQVITAKGYGVRTLGQPEPVTEQTLFNIASVTKQFVAITVGHVLKKHNYTWDTPVRTILGDGFYMKDPYRTAKMTVRDILSHRVGLPRNDVIRVYNYTTAEMMQKLRFLDTTLPIRSHWLYNNILFGLASYIAETLDGRPWEDLLQDRALTPLGMTDTTFVSRRETWVDFASQYQMNDTERREVSLEVNAAMYNTITAPGGIGSNAVDMSKWLQCLLDQGRDSSGQPVLDPELLEDTWRISMPMGFAPLYSRPDDPVTYTRFESYGMGFKRGYYRGYRMISHSGGMGGFASLLTLLPDMNIGVFTSANLLSDHRYDEHVTLYVLDLLLGKEPFLNSTTACPSDARPHDHRLDGMVDLGGPRRKHTPAQRLKVAPSPQDDPSNISATYYNHAYGNLTVYFNETDSEFYMTYGPFVRWKLEHLGDDLTYRGVGQDAFWISTLEFVEFKNCDREICSEVSVPFSQLSPPTFYRDPGVEPPPVAPCATS